MLRLTQYMSSIIKVLDKNLINQIAAGEVIERPVSVVKELVENSLDAGATRIIIETEQGGKSLIRISDNGFGMTKEDLELSVTRHATSKIKTKEDLFKIGTLGFRGEALPSIASVSKLSIASRHQNSSEPNGYLLVMDESNTVKTEKTPLDTGTKVEVRDLFYNLPARLKFLKKDETETGHIKEYICKVILARPEVSFTYINDQKTVFKTQGLNGNYELALKNAVAVVYGSEVAKNLRKIDLQAADISISGFISEPTILSGSRSGQVLFVNNRNIVSPVLNKAVDSAVSDIVPKDKYPYAIVFIDIDYSLVDVNVHPAKKEVRFADSNKVFEAVKSAIRNSYALTFNNKSKAEFQNLVTAVPSFQSKMSFSPGRIDFKAPVTADPLPSYTEQNTASYELEQLDPKLNFSILGQAYKTYIIMLDGDDLLLVDQHAAHERILYEELKVNCSSKKNVQDLLIPQNIELGVKDLNLLAEFKEIFENFGFGWEKFSETSILLRSIPAISAKTPMSEVFKQQIAELNDFQASNPDQYQEKLLAGFACKAAVKAGDVLDIAEMHQLIKNLFNTKNYQTCPHGRPVISLLSSAEISKRFKRT